MIAPKTCTSYLSKFASIQKHVSKRMTISHFVHKLWLYYIWNTLSNIDCSRFHIYILLLKNYLPLFATLFWCQIESRELKICFPKTFGDAYCPKNSEWHHSKSWVELICISWKLMYLDLQRGKSRCVAQIHHQLRRGSKLLSINDEWLVVRPWFYVRWLALI